MNADGRVGVVIKRGFTDTAAVIQCHIFATKTPTFIYYFSVISAPPVI
jgi:hypothetical protein